MTQKLLLRGGLLVDGSGQPGRVGDVLIEGDRILAVGPGLAPAPDEDLRVLDCTGRVVCPGFIDVHTHYDAQIFWDPDLTPSSWHGVTTVVMGNCGFGIAPTRPQDRGTLARVLENVEGMSLEALEAGIRWDFESFPEYLHVISEIPTRINVAAYLGHTPLRHFVLGDDATKRAARPEEIDRMCQLVGEALDAGAIGFSTSHAASHVGAYGQPVASRLAELDEIFALAGVLGERDQGVIEATWGPDLFVDEFAQLAQTIDRPVSWAAIMATRRNPEYAPDVVRRTEAAGGHVTPQIAGRAIVVQIMLTDPGPFANVPSFAEVLALPRKERPARYRDAAWRSRAETEITDSWGDIVDRAWVSESLLHKALVGGPTLGEIALERGTSAFWLMMDLALEEELATRFHVPMTNDNEEQIGEMLQNDHLMLGLSDAGAHTSQLCDADFATYLLEHWWRETGTLTLEKAVWRLTGQPADFLGLSDRGRLCPGAIADIVVFDPETVGTRPIERRQDFPAGADRLVAESTGIEHIFVSGVQTREHGVDLAVDGPGRLIRSSRPKPAGA